MDTTVSLRIRETAKSERAEAILIALRLAGSFLKHEKGQTITPHPEVAACGFVEAGVADILAGDTLYEVKAGDRDFRLTDFRQLITYCGLDYAAPRYEIRKVGLVNPRSGVFFRVEVNELAKACSGRSAPELFLELVDFLSAELVSC